MNKDDLAKLSNGAQAIGMVLFKDRNEMDRSVKLEASDRNLLDRARQGLIELIATGRERLEQRLEILQSHYDKAVNDNPNLQLELGFNSDGKPASPMDANGKIISPPRTWDGDGNYPAPGDGGGVRPEDGEQGELLESTVDKLAETLTDIVMAQGQGAVDKLTEGLQNLAGGENPAVGKEWSVVPGVPEHVENGLVGYVRAGKTKSEAVKAMIASTGLTKLVLEGHFDKLVEQGKIVKEGRSYKAPDKPAAAPASAVETSVQEDILRELRSGLTNKDVVIQTVADATGYDRDTIADIFEEMTDNGQVDQSVSGEWMATEPGNVPTVEVPADPEPEAEVNVEFSEEPATEDPHAPIIAAIFQKISGGLTNKVQLIESVAMELTIPADDVTAAWERLVFAGRLKRGHSGWQVAPVMPQSIAG